MAKDPLFSNKVFGAVLFAGVIATGSGFISGLLYSSDEAESPGYIIEVAEETGSAASKEETGDPTDWAGVQTILDSFNGALDGDQFAAAEKLFKKCVACHSIAEGGPHKVGPNLWAVIDSPIASKDGYNYSSALSGIEKAWTFEETNAFLTNPKKYAPGTKMSYRGLRKANDRALILQYLQDNG